ncbi:hypothetical protein E2C01_052680 [Portunus trituberculatus]|uniref:Uncharacterized protein n=1 Tax=Portunus trituberculatus TaxID=210409 RepID=A0A5B7GMF3_PORTR|nr:hypothetical protein [Portunus trituberculatus]
MVTALLVLALVMELLLLVTVCFYQAVVDITEGFRGSRESLTRLLRCLLEKVYITGQLIMFEAFISSPCEGTKRSQNTGHGFDVRCACQSRNRQPIAQRSSAGLHALAVDRQYRGCFKATRPV